MNGLDNLRENIKVKNMDPKNGNEIVTQRFVGILSRKKNPAVGWVEFN